MDFNDKWTKEVNDHYRKMVKEKKSMSEIEEYFGDLMKYHPKKKFNRGIYTYENFTTLLNEITIHPNYIYFTFKNEQSLRYKNGKDIICYFNINNVDYILKLEYLIENNQFFQNRIVYNIFFTTKEQYDIFIKMSSNKSASELEFLFSDIQKIVEEETNKGDVIKILNAISYILLKIANHITDPIYILTETMNLQKINFYKKSIEDSFKGKYELLIGKSIFFDGLTYYYIIK